MICSQSTTSIRNVKKLFLLIIDTSDPFKTVKFLEEGLLMKNFDHPNVLGLLGLTFDSEGQPLIVLPFMANGDLKSFVLKQNKVFFLLI